MFNVQLKSPNDGIASGPRGAARSTSYGDGCNPLIWGCYPIDEAPREGHCSWGGEECQTINTCEPYDEPEYEGANDLMAGGGDGEPE